MTTTRHDISVDDDEAQVLAACSCGWSFKSSDRNEKFEMVHTHLATSFRQARHKGESK